ncbi:hypothetical protein [uncultured Microbacterium sp.]|uniref:hypothetical protein n=1 Tax=uncultured Microbacterium sp. TaxID=191216 RepID=UPI002602D64E|nr:hypothetical protein [uncultured Microbacterium sp.]
MTTRTATSIVVKTNLLTLDGEERTVYYGPFLPHAGSATKLFLASIDRELSASGKYRHWETSIESVFIAPDESDCVVTATR